MEIDASDFAKFVASAKKNARAGIRSYHTKGGQLLVRAQKQQAAQRFGTETTESRMKTVAAERPKESRPQGHYAATIRALLVGDEKHVGPDAPYDVWIEDGSDAPEGIPAKLANASFRGHKPVRRSVEESRPKLRQLFTREMTGAMQRSVGL